MRKMWPADYLARGALHGAGCALTGVALVALLAVVTVIAITAFGPQAAPWAIIPTLVFIMLVAWARSRGPSPGDRY